MFTHLNNNLNKEACAQGKSVLHPRAKHKIIKDTITLEFHVIDQGSDFEFNENIMDYKKQRSPSGVRGNSLGSFKSSTSS